MLEKYVVTHNFIPKALAKNCFSRIVNLCKNTTALRGTLLNRVPIHMVSG